MESEGTFDCNGKVNCNDWVLNKSTKFFENEIEQVIFTSRENPCFLGDVMLFDQILPAPTAILNLKHLSSCTEMRLKLLNRYRNQVNLIGSKAAKDQPEFFSTRKNIYKFLVYVRSYLYSIKWNIDLIENVNSLIGRDFVRLLFVLKSFLKGLKSFNDPVFHYAPSNLGNKCVQPDYHIYHLHLELRWLVITLLHAKEWPQEFPVHAEILQESNYSMRHYNFSSQSIDLDSTVAEVIDDLVYIATKLFARIPLIDLSIKTPYSCTCARELWLMLQIFIDDLSLKRKSKTFWQYVNDSLDKRIGATETGESRSWTERREYNYLNCKYPEIFCIWLIYHLALLYGYNSDGSYVGVYSGRVQPNYVQLEKVLKVYVSKGGKSGERDEIEEELEGAIPLLTTLTYEWWKPCVRIVSLVWDCFHRRLDQPFLLQSIGPWLVSIDKKGPADILKEIKHRLEDNIDKNKLSSYGMFLRMLGLSLRKSTLQNESKYWNQLKGRIYSNFTTNRVEEFSENGLYNFISLFITLALTANSPEPCRIMLELLPSILTEGRDRKSRIVIWKGKLTVLFLFAEQQISFSEVSERFMKEVDVISCCQDETSRSMLSVYIDVFDHILMSSKNIELHEYSLIGGWIDRYFLECPDYQAKALLVALMSVFDKCVQLRISCPDINSATSGSTRMLEALWKHVAGRVRMLVLEAQMYGDHYEILSELAARFTLEAMRNPVMAARHDQNFLSLFRHFSSSPVIKDVRIIQSYLKLILRDQKAAEKLKQEFKNFDSIIIQAWVKCCIMNKDGENDEINYLTSYVIDSDEIRKTFQSNPDIIAMRNNTEPILHFIKAFQSRFESLQNQKERLSLSAKCREYFMHIDRWAMIWTTEKTKDSELTYWIYRCVGRLIFCCSPLLYVQSQPNSMLMVLINKFMIPTDTTQNIMNIGRKIFSIVILGIGRLNVRNDLSLQSLVKNLFDNYLPRLITNASNTESCKVSETLLKCFHGDNINFLRMIIEILTIHFIVPRDRTTHNHCSLVILLFKNLIKSGNSYGPHIIDMIISISLSYIITCYMKVHALHAHKRETIDFISHLTLSSYYKEDPKQREKIVSILTNAAPKYLSASPTVFFELITSVCQMIPESRHCIMSEMRKTILEFEKKKYPNIAHLRFSLAEFERRIQS